MIAGPEYPNHVREVAEEAQDVLAEWHDGELAKLQRKWVDWLTATGYPFDWQGIGDSDVGGGKPPCTAEELARSHWDREHAEGNLSPDDSVEEWLESVRSELGED